MQKLKCDLKYGLEFKFATLEIFLKMKLDTGSICKYEKLKLRNSCEIYLIVHDGNQEPDLLC